MRTILSTVCYLTSILFLIGCGGADMAGRPVRVPAGGVVMMNGQPVSGATVVFSPVSHQNGASAMTDQEGRFQLRTFDPDDGAVPGLYKVTIRKVEMLPGTPVRSGEGGSGGEGGEEEDEVPAPIEKFITPEKYSRASTTDLEADVEESGTNEFTFEL